MYTLQLLHANDLEGGVNALESAPNFAAIVDSLEGTHANSILISAGDNYIPGPFFSTAADFSMGGTLSDAYTRYFTEVQGLDLAAEGVTIDLGRGGGRVDISIMNILGFDASAVGNHEFDPGTSAFAEIIGGEGGDDVIEWPGTFFPYLSSNLDFSADADLGPLFTDQILSTSEFDEPLADLAEGTFGASIAPAAIIEEGGELIGVVGATTQIIETISSTGGVDETTGGANNMVALAAVIQPQIDALTTAGVNKIILTSHLQQIALEKELAGLLDGVDIIIAGGSNTLQADAQDTLRDGDSADETYPFLTTDASGNDVAIVSTDGEYSYVGRLVVDFDDDGNLIASSIEDSVSGAFATDEAGVLAVTGAATVEDAIAASTRADIIDDLTDAVADIVEAADAITFGNHDVFLDGRRASVRTEETNLGNLSADANLAAARMADDTVTVSFKNGGGIRAEIGSAGDTGTDEGDGLISQLDLQNSLRFNNDLTLVTVSAEGFLLMLEHAVADTDTDAGNTPGRFPQIGGFRFSFDEDGTAQEFVTDTDGNYVTDPATGLPQVATAGSRVQTVALIDPVTGDETIIVENGALTAAAPESIRMVTLDFLVENNGDGYPFQELATDIAFVTQDGGTTPDTEADNILEEQEALGNYMTANFPDEDNAFAQAEQDVFNDARIVQLARNGDIDRILLDENDPKLAITLSQMLESGETELFTGGSEVVATEGGRAYVTNGAQDRIDVFDLATGDKVLDIDLSTIPGFDGVQSVAVKNGIVAAAIAVEPEENNGVVALFDTAGNQLNVVEVGNLPDMVTFTADGTKILVANEGEPIDVIVGGTGIETSEAQEVVMVADGPATGSFDFTLDDEELTVTGSFSGLSSALLDVSTDGVDAEGNPIDAIHLHIGAPGTNGPVVRALTVTDNGDGSGSYTGTFELEDEELAELQAGNFYVNIHTVDNPGGELRGQLPPRVAFADIAPAEDDPLGGVSIIDVSGGAAAATVTTLDFTAFDGQEDTLRDAGVLIQPGNSASADLEPEYITVLPDGETAWVSLQEANAYAVVDLTTMTVTDIRSFGTVDRSLPGFEIDASNKDDAINLQNYDNLFGMRMPDAIASAEIGGETYIFTANEGDARDFSEAAIEDLLLDPTAFPNAEILQQDAYLANLDVRADLGDTDGDGDYDQLFHYGSRSFTIYNAAGDVVFDSGSMISQLIAEIRPELFNADDGEFDGRSDNKGVEPEAIAVGQIGAATYLFVGLERDNGVMVFDVSNPMAPVFDQYIAGEDNGNLSPETIAFIPASESVTGVAQIAVAYEGDGNTAVFNVEAGLAQNGSATDDVLIGGAASDTLFGAEGNDSVFGNGGDDFLFGAAGDDVLGGGAGDDVARGGDGNDSAWGAAGDDTLSGEAGDDVLGGAAGSDMLDGDAGDDQLWAGLGDDTLSGGGDNDQLGGFDGDDLLLAGAGDDTAWAGRGDDTVWGGAGNDMLMGGGDDDLMGGGAGDDTIDGGAGDDSLYGGAGSDLFVFEAGADMALDFSTADDRLQLDDALWSASGTLTTTEVVTQFASLNTEGNIVFDFGNGDSIELDGVTRTTGLDALIDIA